MTMVGVIPARGGSKGIARKNVRVIAGRPLIYWTIRAAQQSKLLDDFFVSTEDAEIAAAARGFGAKVLLRPMELAADDTTTLQVLQHIVTPRDWHSVVLLQPTSPLRDIDSIDRCISEYRVGAYDTLATGYTCKMLEYGSHRNARRQDIQGFFYDDGNIYIIATSMLLQGRWTGDRICRRQNAKELTLEIDDEVDFFLVEKLLERRLLGSSQPR